MLALRLLVLKAFVVVLALVAVLVVLASLLAAQRPERLLRVASAVRLIALRQSQEPLVVA